MPHAENLFHKDIVSHKLAVCSNNASRNQWTIAAPKSSSVCTAHYLLAWWVHGLHCCGTNQALGHRMRAKPCSGALGPFRLRQSSSAWLTCKWSKPRTDRACHNGLFCKQSAEVAVLMVNVIQHVVHVSLGFPDVPRKASNYQVTGSL